MNFPPPTPHQARIIWFALTALAVSLSVAIGGAILWGLGRVLVVLSPVLWPIAVAGVIAFILDPVVEWLVRRGAPRWRAISLVFGAAAILVLGVFGSVMPRVVVEARNLVESIQTQYAPNLKKRVQEWINHPPAPLQRFLPPEWFGGGEPLPLEDGVGSGRAGDVPIPEREPGDRVVSEGAIEDASGLRTERADSVGTEVQVGAPAGPAIDPMGEGLPWWSKALDPGALRSAGDWLVVMLPEAGRWILGQVGRVASWFGILVGLALIPIYAFYFLLEKAGIERHWAAYLPVADSRFKDELVWLVRNINDALIAFFRGQVLVAMCDGVLYTVGFLAIGLPYAVLLGLMATVLTIVPFLGAIVTCGSALVIAFVQFGDWQHPLLVLVVFFLVQGLEGWVIQPKIIGDRVGLHPITIIIALLVGTTLMGGILGGLLAIPATAVLRALMFRYVWRARGVESGQKVAMEGGGLGGVGDGRG